jgi:hypothetical protein
MPGAGAIVRHCIDEILCCPQSAEGVRKAGVRGSGIDEERRSELAHTAQALHRLTVDDHLLENS